MFVSEGYDEIKQSYFYRALGGGIDFGESSEDALRREFQEELQAELTNIKLIDCVENLFVYNGKPGHEIIFLYQCDFVDSKFYEAEEISFIEGSDTHIARWIAGDRFTSGELRLVPPACVAYV